MRPDTLLHEMDAWSVEHAVIAPWDEFIAVYNREGNQSIAAIVRAHPDRFSGLAVANPWYGPKAVEILREGFDLGLVGICLHPGRQGFHLTESIVDSLVEVCVEYERPIYSHTGTPICAEPFQLAELARRYPEAAFVMGSAAWSDFCGYDVIPAAEQAPNILVEMSCAAPGFLKTFLERIGPDRALFGSAYPRSCYSFEINKIMRLGLPADVLGKLMSANARRLWGIDTRPFPLGKGG